MEALHKVLNMPDYGVNNAISQVLNMSGQRFAWFQINFRLICQGSEYGMVVYMHGYTGC